MKSILVYTYGDPSWDFLSQVYS